MSYNVNVIIAFTPSGMTLDRKKHGINVINRVMERHGRGYFDAGDVGNTSWSWRNPQAIDLYVGTFSHLSEEFLVRLVRRVAKCLPGSVQLFIHEAERDGAILEEYYPRAMATERTSLGYGDIRE